MNRRLFLSAAAGMLTSCAPHFYAGDALNDSPAARMLSLAQTIDARLIGTHGLARTYRESDIDRDFRRNGLPTPRDAHYGALMRERFAGYRLMVDGLVGVPLALSLEHLRAHRSAAQITRHDCVEGWSAIGQWSGVPLAAILERARPNDAARYAVFHCFDRDRSGTPYYESLDLVQAAHPQALLALDLNGRPLDADHGAPVRLRVPTQLGYKSAKWVQRIELVASFDRLFGGSGGYWEDLGYEWYAGI